MWVGGTKFSYVRVLFGRIFFLIPKASFPRSVLMTCKRTDTLDRVSTNWKVRENHIKFKLSLESQGKSGKVRDIWKFLNEVREKSGKRILEHFRAVKFKIFFNHGESTLWSSEISMKIIHFVVFQSTRVQNFLQPWWKYSLILWDIYENPSFCCISEH